MITTSMLRRQLWIADDDEFDHILENSQRVLKLNAQYENHPYVEDFPKECSVIFIYGTYVLEGEADVKFSLVKIWNLLQVGLVPNNTANFCRFFNQTHNIMMDNEKHRDGKHALVRGYRKSSTFAGYHIFAPTGKN